MSWSALLADPPDALVLRFRRGSKRDPEGEWALVVGGDGKSVLDVRREPSPLRVESTIDREEVRRLFALLAATGFPQVIGYTVPAGRGMLAIEVTGGPEDVPVVLHRALMADLPEWRALVAALDGVCDRLARG